VDIKSKPLVSGIIIFFNGENFLEEAIQSVLAQTYSNWELLLVDDGSTDGSTEIARTYAGRPDCRIIYLEHPGHQNLGMSASRNLGVREARGEYVAFLDHDDIWLPNKLQDQVAILESQPEAGMMYGRTRYWHGWTGRTEDAERDGFTFLGVEPNRLVKPPHLFTLFLGDDRTIASTCSVLIRRKVFEQVGGYDEAFRSEYSDMVFLAKAYLEVPVFVSDACWDHYRQHPDNSTSTALRTGTWHPGRPNPAREKFLNRVETLLSEKRVEDGELVEALKKELAPYRNRNARTPRQVFYDLCSDASLALLRGEDARPLIDEVGDVHDSGLTGGMVADWFLDVVPPARIGDPPVWHTKWPALAQRVNQFLEALEAQAGVSGLGESAMSELRRRVQNTWLLRVEEGNAARLEFPPENPDMLRVAIARGASGNSYDIQLNQSRLKVVEGHRYLLTFLARADQTRDLSFGMAKAHDPWSNLGLYRQVALTQEWQCFEETFVATEDEDRARVHFDLGGSGVSTELSTITLRSLSEGRYVEPATVSTREGRRIPTRVLDEAAVPFGQVKFGSFLRVTPINRNWGADRGCPVDRYYIEKFLSLRRRDIQGHVLEIGDDAYTRKFGGDRVQKRDVLHVAEGNSRATIIGDLAHAPHIPSDSFDCIILTQTLQLIYEARAAIQTLYRILKPGGVVLATFPGISQTYDSVWSTCWYWNFTPLSGKRMFEEAFAPADIKLQTFGNVLAAISFLQGLAAEEFTPQELDFSEPGYEVTISVRARKGGAVS